MKDLIFAIGVLVLILLVAMLLHTLFVWGAWNLLIVPVWGAAAMTFKQALALTVFVNILIPSLAVKANGKKD